MAAILNIFGKEIKVLKELIFSIEKLKIMAWLVFIKKMKFHLIYD